MAKRTHKIKVPARTRKDAVNTDQDLSKPMEVIIPVMPVENETSAHTGEPLPEDSPDGPTIEAKADGNGQRKLKVTVYAITKNESKFVERWMASMCEADEIVVLDTGSTDGTPDLITAEGLKRKVRTTVVVKKYVPWDSITEYRSIVARGDEPWRFDRARNDSLKFVSEDTDICVCTDLDEVLLPGWRAKLEAAWLSAIERGEKPTTATYEYVWNFNADGSDGAKFTYEKAHAPGVCEWTHPVHEILSYSVDKVCVAVEGMRLEHHADPSKSRGQYLKLLELSVAEDPDDDRNVHYLGREYMFHRRWNDAIETLERHLRMPNATWRPERATSMRFIARCYGEIGYPLRQECYLWQAVNEAPEQREAPLELAEFVYAQIMKERDQAKRDYQKLVRVCEIIIERKERVMTYLTRPEAWGARPWDLLSIGLWYTGRRREAVVAINEAILYSPDDKRLNDNLALMQRLMAEDEGK